MKVLDLRGYFCSMLFTSHGIHSKYSLLENVYLSVKEKRKEN